MSTQSAVARSLASSFSRRNTASKCWFGASNMATSKKPAREKQLKTWERKWKLALIEPFNRDWRDLYEQLNA